MKLTFIGTGSAFTVGGNYQSNMLLESESGKRLLIDCGSDVRHALHDLGLDHNDIDSIYISHLHADHIGGLEWVAFKTMFDPEKPRKLDLYCHQTLVKGLWGVLSGGLSSLDDTEASISTYFTLHKLLHDGSFMWEGVEFHLFQTYHQISNGKLMPSYGLDAEIDGIKVVLTTDTKFPSDDESMLTKKYQTADIIFQDCETASFKSTVHAHYTELLTLDPEIKKKMWLYHYQPGPLPDAMKDGFRGFVKKGQSFNFKDKASLYNPE